jgi:hypothetical protein
MSARPSAALLAGCLALGCAARAQEAGAPPTRAPGERVLVFYTPGACAAGQLEVEIYDRALRSWRPHPEHPRLAPGACVLEAPGQLLNELRVRCLDPSGKRPPSAWVVGAEVAPGATPCKQTSGR